MSRTIRISLFSVLNKTSEVHFRSHIDNFRYFYPVIIVEKRNGTQMGGAITLISVCSYIIRTESKFRDHMTLYSVSRGSDTGSITGPGSNAISQNSSYSNFPPI